MKEDILRLQTPLTQHTCTIKPPATNKSGVEMFKTSQLMKEAIHK